MTTHDVNARVCYVVGDRHFVKEELPRIRYVNPAVDIQIEKRLKTKEEVWKPEMVIELSESRAARALLSVELTRLFSSPSASASRVRKRHDAQVGHGRKVVVDDLQRAA